MSSTELSFNEIGFIEIGGGSMFYLYIDEVLISPYHLFSEVRDFIFDFYYDIVKRSSCMHIETFTNAMDGYMDQLILGLIFHQYEYFKFYEHEVQVYYGNY